jgi:hypothetical protein
MYLFRHACENRNTYFIALFGTLILLLFYFIFQCGFFNRKRPEEQYKAMLLKKKVTIIYLWKICTKSTIYSKTRYEDIFEEIRLSRFRYEYI